MVVVVVVVVVILVTGGRWRRCGGSDGDGERDNGDSDRGSDVTGMTLTRDKWKLARSS